MDSDPKDATEPRAAEVAARPAAVGVSAGTVLLIGIWIGLIAGFCDVGLLVLKRRLINRDFYRVGGDFPWIVPAGVMIIVLVPACLIAVFAWIRGSVRLGVPVGLLAFFGLLDMCARLPLELWASMVVCGGIAAQSVRFIGRRRTGFLRLVRRTVGLLVGILLATMAVTMGGRVWSEHRQESNLPAAATGAQNVLLIVWDTVRAANTSLYGYSRATTPNLERLASRGVRCDRAFSTSSWTLPSNASMFT